MIYLAAAGLPLPALVAIDDKRRLRLALPLDVPHRWGHPACRVGGMVLWAVVAEVVALACMGDFVRVAVEQVPGGVKSNARERLAGMLQGMFGRIEEPARWLPDGWVNTCSDMDIVELAERFCPALDLVGSPAGKKHVGLARACALAGWMGR